MANKSYYHRSFIILKAESKGYEFIPNKEPAGYCKFEIRRGVGKAYIYVQDIKPSSALNGVYEAYLISVDDAIRPCKLASIHIDEGGRGEHIASFDADDIKGSGNTLENFHALVIAFRSGIEERSMRIAYPLVGYSSKNLNIDTRKITESLKTIHGEGVEIEVAFEPEVEPEPEPAPEIETKLEIESEGELEIEIEPELEIEFDAEPQIEPELEIETEPELQIEGYPVPEPDMEFEITPDIRLGPLPTYPERYVEPTNEEVDWQEEAYRQAEEELRRSEEELKQAYEDSYQEFLEDLAFDEKSYPSARVTYWDNVKDYFTGLFKAHQGISPFGSDMEDTKWVKVQQSGIGQGGYYTESPYRYPYYNSAYPDHYIVGLIKAEGEVKYVVYGIPSMYSMIPPISINGFSRWMPIKEGYGMGYWLLYIDAVSGSVVHPYEKE